MDFRAQRSTIPDSALDGALVRGWTATSVLALSFIATKGMTLGTNHRVAAARKAMSAVQRKCKLLSIRDLTMQCKLFDALVLYILSHARESGL